MYLSRHIEKKLKFTSQHAKVVLLVGARQVGKSTLLSHCFPNIPHITFDPIQDFYNVRQDPDLFLKQFNTPVILDEIQFYPEVLSAIKRKVDQSTAPGQYFLTGSQNLSVLKNVSETMAGRVAILQLSPLTIHELHSNAAVEQHWLPLLLEEPESLPVKFKGILSSFFLWKSLWQGGLPGLIDLPIEAYQTIFQSYIQTYVERDVRLLENIQDLRSFDRFIRVVAALSSQEINLTQLGGEIGISYKTVSRWLNLLSYTYQWYQLDPYHSNTLKRITKKPKGIFSDTGLACHLIRLTSEQAVGSYPQLGSLFESFIFNQINSMSNSLNFPANLYHWRTKHGVEVDIVIEKDGCLFPIEIKTKSVLSKQDAKGIKIFQETYSNNSTKKIKKGVIIYPGEHCFYLDQNVIALPCHGIFG